MILTPDLITFGELLWDRHRPLACMDFEFEGDTVQGTVAVAVSTYDEHMAAFRRRILRDGFQFFTLN